MQNRNLTARNEKNSACDFFSHSGNFDAISCKKMREYRKIAPENDPCNLLSGAMIELRCKSYIEPSPRDKLNKKNEREEKRTSNTDSASSEVLNFLPKAKDDRDERNKKNEREEKRTSNTDSASSEVLNFLPKAKDDRDERNKKNEREEKRTSNTDSASSEARNFLPKATDAKGNPMEVHMRSP